MLNHIQSSWAGCPVSKDAAMMGKIGKTSKPEGPVNVRVSAHKKSGVLKDFFLRIVSGFRLSRILFGAHLVGGFQFFIVHPCLLVV